MLSATLDLLTSRRGLLGLGAAAAAATALPSAVSAAPKRGRRPLDLTNPADHLRTFVKMSASEEDGAETLMLYEGVTFGLTGNSSLRALYGMMGFSPVRTFKQPDGSVRFVANEAAVFTDLATGKVLDTWANPYLDGEVVKVWHLRNGPVNYAIHPNKPISGGGWSLLRPSAYGTNGFFMPVSIQGENLVVALDAQANRKNPLDPTVWRRESSGPHLQYSEHNTWRVPLAAIEDPRQPSPQPFASWHSHKEWRPWMLMGQRPGGIYNHLVARKIASRAEIPAVLRAHIERELPAFMSAPKEWTGGYRTDWDYFKEQRTPAA